MLLATEEMILSAEIRRNPEIVHGLCRQQTTADGEGHSCYCEEDDRWVESEQRHKELGDDGESRREQQNGEGVLSDDERSFPEELGHESIYRQPEYCHHVGEPQAADQDRIRTLPGSNAHDGDDDGKQ